MRTLQDLIFRGDVDSFVAWDGGLISTQNQFSLLFKCLMLFSLLHRIDGRHTGQLYRYCTLIGPTNYVLVVGTWTATACFFHSQTRPRRYCQIMSAWCLAMIWSVWAGMAVYRWGDITQIMIPFRIKEFRILILFSLCALKIENWKNRGWIDASRVQKWLQSCRLLLWTEYRRRRRRRRRSCTCSRR